MFSYLRKNLQNYALGLKDFNGEVLFLNYKETKPLTRLHINQMIAGSIKNNLGFEWVDLYVSKINHRERFKSIIVCKALYDENSRKNRVLEVIYEKSIR